MMTDITSAKNHIISEVKKLESSSYRKKQGKFLIEGERLVCDAYHNGCHILYVLICEDYTGKIPDDVKCYRVARKVFDIIKSTVNSQGIAAVAKTPDINFDQTILDDSSLIVYLDGIQDPGNMGTIIRTCDACGVDMVVMSPYCADVFNPKVVRSTMASLFNVKLGVADVEVFDVFKDKGFLIYATSLGDSVSYYDADFSGKSVIVIGNEANGVRKELLSISDKNIRIPMVGKAESLNASVACGVVLYEALRQRRDSDI